MRALARSCDPAVAEAVNAFLTFRKERAARQDADASGLLDLLGRLTALRRTVAEQMDRQAPQQRSRMRLADIGLEAYAFALLSEYINQLGDLSGPGAWAALLRLLVTALDNVQFGQIDPEECSALRSEFSAWADGFSLEDRFHLLRTLASLGRARRLAEDYTDRINRLFTPRVEEIGRALGVVDHALKVFSEGDIRGHVVFQLSRLVDLGLQAARQALKLPPWEAVVPGEAVGTLVRAADLTDVESEEGPLLLLLERADGDAEIPTGVKGVALGHPMPHLSHLGVRARQARVPFAACMAREHLEDYASFVGKRVVLRVAPDGLSMREAAGEDAGTEREETSSVVLPACHLLPSSSSFVLPLDQAQPETCGAKAATAQRLLEMAGRSGGLFRAPRGLALPFGVMERCLEQAPAIRDEYRTLQERLPGTPLGELEGLLQRLRELVLNIPLPDDIEKAVVGYFGPDARLAVRSSANGEDLEHLAGAGLYESVVNVSPAAVREAIGQVWSSLWTRRAAVSRMQSGIAHDRIHMAVLLQELVRPDLSFIMHTINPLTGNRDEALVEAAVGLGEVLASSASAGDALSPGVSPQEWGGCAPGLRQFQLCAAAFARRRRAGDLGAAGLFARCSVRRCSRRAEAGQTAGEDRDLSGRRTWSAAGRGGGVYRRRDSSRANAGAAGTVACVRPDFDSSFATRTVSATMRSSAPPPSMRNHAGNHGERKGAGS